MNAGARMRLREDVSSVVCIDMNRMQCGGMWLGRFSNSDHSDTEDSRFSDDCVLWCSNIGTSLHTILDLDRYDSIDSSKTIKNRCTYVAVFTAQTGSSSAEQEADGGQTLTFA